jgi:hypothetical protein
LQALAFSFPAATTTIMPSTDAKAPVTEFNVELYGVPRDKFTTDHEMPCPLCFDE